jgi:hypothetical protein
LENSVMASSPSHTRSINHAHTTTIGFRELCHN